MIEVAAGQNEPMTQPGNGNGGGVQNGEGGDGDQHVMVVGPDGRPVGMARVPQQDDGEESQGVGAMVEQPAKVMRIGTMIKQLLEEVRTAPLDDASRNRLRAILSSSVEELEQGLAPELRDELNRLSTPFADDATPSRRGAADRPGPARRLARGPVPGHPDGAVRPADGGAGAAGADAARAAPGPGAGPGPARGHGPWDRSVPVDAARAAAPAPGAEPSDPAGTLGPWRNP